MPLIQTSNLIFGAEEKLETLVVALRLQIGTMADGAPFFLQTRTKRLLFEGLGNVYRRNGWPPTQPWQATKMVWRVQHELCLPIPLQCIGLALYLTQTSRHL